MKDFTLAEIAKACNGEYVGNESLKNAKITSVERDSRQVKNGSLFLAIKGERVAVSFTRLSLPTPGRDVNPAVVPAKQIQYSFRLNSRCR